jgi:hypothetical protein
MKAARLTVKELRLKLASRGQLRTKNEVPHL